MTVAIKKISCIYADSLSVKRLLRELALLRNLRHPNIISIIEVLTGNADEERRRKESIEEWKLQHQQQQQQTVGADGVPDVDSPPHASARAQVAPSAPSVLPACPSAELDVIYLVSEALPQDLGSLIAGRHAFDDDAIRSIMFQVLRAVTYLHSVDIIHRDIKPSNILVDEHFRVKLCDFGLARVDLAALHDDPTQARTDRDRDRDPSAEPDEPPLIYAMTEQVVSRWYRAPEVFLSQGRYGVALDVWSCGCVLAELLGRQPLFPGRHPMHQMQLITDVLGRPSDEDLITFPDIANPCKAYLQSLFQSRVVGGGGVGGGRLDGASNLALLYPFASKDAIDLLAQLLKFSPRRRVKAYEAMQHVYFDSLFESVHLPDRMRREWRLIRQQQQQQQQHSSSAMVESTALTIAHAVNVLVLDRGDRNDRSDRSDRGSKRTTVERDSGLLKSAKESVLARRRSNRDTPTEALPTITRARTSNEEQTSSELRVAAATNASLSRSPSRLGDLTSPVRSPSSSVSALSSEVPSPSALALAAEARSRIIRLPYHHLRCSCLRCDHCITTSALRACLRDWELQHAEIERVEREKYGTSAEKAAAAAAAATATTAGTAAPAPLMPVMPVGSSSEGYLLLRETLVRQIREFARPSTARLLEEYQASRAAAAAAAALLQRDADGSEETTMPSDAASPTTPTLLPPRSRPQSSTSSPSPAQPSSSTLGVRPLGQGASKTRAPPLLTKHASFAHGGLGVGLAAPAQQATISPEGTSTPSTPHLNPPPALVLRKSTGAAGSLTTEANRVSQNRARVAAAMPHHVRSISLPVWTDVVSSVANGRFTSVVVDGTPAASHVPSRVPSAGTRAGDQTKNAAGSTTTAESGGASVPPSSNTTEAVPESPPAATGPAPLPRDHAHDRDHASHPAQLSPIQPLAVPISSRRGSLSQIHPGTVISSDVPPSGLISPVRMRASLPESPTAGTSTNAVTSPITPLLPPLSPPPPSATPPPTHATAAAAASGSNTLPAGSRPRVHLRRTSHTSSGPRVDKLPSIDRGGGIEDASESGSAPRTSRRSTLNSPTAMAAIVAGVGGDATDELVMTNTGSRQRRATFRLDAIVPPVAATGTSTNANAATTLVKDVANVHSTTSTAAATATTTTVAVKSPPSNRVVSHSTLGAPSRAKSTAPVPSHTDGSLPAPRSHIPSIPGSRARAHPDASTTAADPIAIPSRVGAHAGLFSTSPTTHIVSGAAPFPAPASTAPANQAFQKRRQQQQTDQLNATNTAAGTGDDTSPFASLVGVQRLVPSGASRRHTQPASVKSSSRLSGGGGVGPLPSAAASSVASPPVHQILLDPEYEVPAADRDLHATGSMRRPAPRTRLSRA